MELKHKLIQEEIDLLRSVYINMSSDDEDTEILGMSSYEDALICSLGFEKIYDSNWEGSPSSAPSRTHVSGRVRIESGYNCFDVFVSNQLLDIHKFKPL